MKALTIRPRTIVPAGHVYLMPNAEHPEVDLWTTLDEAEHLIVACHPDDEEKVRDVIAMEQERPEWWRDMRRMQQALDLLAKSPGTEGGDR